MGRIGKFGNGSPSPAPQRRRRPRLRFQSGTVLFIWFATFLSCFVLYMVGQNLFGPDTPELSVSAADSAPAQSDSAGSDSTGSGTDTTGTDTTTAASGTTTASGAETTDTATQTTAATTTAGTTAATGDGVKGVNPLPETPAQSDAYLSECAFIGDSITQGLSDYQLVPAKNVFAGVGMNLDKVMTKQIDTVYGKCTVTEAVTQAQPKRIYTMLGSNGISWIKQETMIKEYGALLDAMAQAVPGVKFYILSIPPVTAGRETAAEGAITNAAVDAYNSALLALANSRGCYYVDVNTALKGNDGKLPLADASSDGIHFKAATYRLFLDYILKHTGQ